MPTDLEPDVSDKPESSRVADTKTKSDVDYESKYRGLSTAYSRLESDLKAARVAMDKAIEDKEVAENKVRSYDKDKAKENKDLVTERDTLLGQIEAANKRLAKFDAEKSVTKLVKDKFSDKSEALLGLLEDGDLRTPDEFDKPEDYDTYLTRIAGKVASNASAQTQSSTDADDYESQEVLGSDGILNSDNEPVLQATNMSSPILQPTLSQARRELLNGITPSVNLGRDSKNSVRSIQQIEQDMWNLNIRDPKYGDKYLALEQEQNQALAQSRR